MPDVVTLGTLDLMDQTKHFILPDTLDLSTPGQVRFTLMFVGTDPADRVANENAVQQTLNLAAIRARQYTGEWVSLGLGRMTDTVSYDVRRGTLSPRSIEIGGRYSQADVTLIVLPYAIGAPITISDTSIITDGGAGLLITDIPGDCPEGALVRLELDDVSTSGVVNWLQFGRYSGSGLLAASDAAPWVNLAAMTGASTVTEATAFGGSVASRATTSTTPVDLARAVQPAGDLAEGRRDVWVRYKATGTAMSAPGTPTLTAQDATKIVTSNRIVADIIFGATGFATSSNGTITPSWSTATQASSLLIFAVLQRSSSAVTSFTTPSGWKRLIGGFFGGNAADVSGVNIRLDLFYKRNAASASGSQSATGLQTAAGSSHAAWLLELQNADLIMGYEIDSVNGPSSQPTVDTTNLKTAFDKMLELAIFETDASGDLTDFPWNGYIEFPALSGRNSVVVYQIVENANTDIPAPKVDLTSATDVQVNALLHIKPKITTETVMTYSDPVPGSLPAGSYVARVQAEDAYGNRSNASNSSATATLANDNGALTVNWTAPAGDVAQYVVTLQSGTTYREFATGTTATSFTITDLANGQAVAGLPATVGAVAPAPRIVPRVGTTGQASADLLPLESVTLIADNTWRLARLATGRELPPAAATQDGERAEWAIETQVRSANGLSASVTVDALFMTPHNEPSATVWKRTLNLGTKRRWVIESHRSGRGLIVRTENLSTGVITESLIADGSLTLASGMDSILSMAMAQVGGASALGVAKMQVAAITVWPRYVWNAEVS